MRLLQIGLIVILVLQQGSLADASVKPNHPRLIVEGVPTIRFNSSMRLLQIGLIVILVLQQGSLADASVKPNHPRLIVEGVPTMAQRCLGPLAEDYRVVKERADAAARRGDAEFISNPW